MDTAPESGQQLLGKPELYSLNLAKDPLFRVRGLVPLDRNGEDVQLEERCRCELQGDQEAEADLRTAQGNPQRVADESVGRKGNRIDRA